MQQTAADHPFRNHEEPPSNEQIELERTGRHRVVSHRVRGAGAGRSGRQDLVQQVPALPLGRRRRQEQGRTRAQRARRPQVGHGGGLQLLRRQQEFRHHLGQGSVPRLHQGSEGEVPGTKMFFGGIKNDKEANDLWAYVSQFDKDGKTK